MIRAGSSNQFATCPFAEVDFYASKNETGIVEGKKGRSPGKLTSQDHPILRLS